ncbi:amphoterin-induced protein 3 [Betta splendens]|uniref:Amphoterin-induced protein 3 n=1 Tax=Betta splendens TaxID=158456 RepID=A0A6P7N2L7_BETSP|nr:amphoterin-induced protein 3 [Betta splendens]
MPRVTSATPATPATSARGPARLLLMLGLLRASELTCPPMCLCISDTASCSSSGLAKLPLTLPSFSVTLDLSHNHLTWLASGSFSHMPRLENLRMGHNYLSSLRPGAFHNATGLRHLDLSSNRLKVVEPHYFQGLWRLEELLLYNNKITQVEAGALSGLSSLKKVYFSLNQITHFPFFSIREHSHPFLAMLDLSSNRLARLPWEEVKALPGLLQRGLYLHNNSMICDCSMYSVLWRWDAWGYDALRDFREQHVCSIAGDPRASIRLLQQPRYFNNCTVERASAQPVAVLLSNVHVSEGSRLLLDCPTPLSGADLSFSWLSPRLGPVSAAEPLLHLFANGTLEIREAAVNDSGLYVCTAVDAGQSLNATREVNVTVVPGEADSFSTGYTTLLGCLVTMLLILMYLYLTPCRCGCCKQPKPPFIPIVTYDPGAFPYSASEPPKSQSSKHVAFMEPMTGDAGAEWTPES